MFPQCLKNVRVADKKTAVENEALQAAVKQAEETLGDGGRILLRESGTEPLIRVMVEAGTAEECERYVDAVVAVMKNEGLAVS